MTVDKDEPPPVSLALISRLQELYPPKEPSQEDTERQIFFYSGQRAIVKLLQQWHDWRTKDGIMD